MTLRLASVLTAVLVVPACSSDPATDESSGSEASDSEGSASEGSGSESAGACLADDPAALLQVENRTGNPIAVLFFVHCDGTEATEFPVPPPGLADGEDLTVPLPGPGCWLLNYSGDGCEGYMPVQTTMDVCAGETYVWTVGLDNHICQG